MLFMLSVLQPSNEMAYGSVGLEEVEVALETTLIKTWRVSCVQILI